MINANFSRNAKAIDFLATVEGLRMRQIAPPTLPKISREKPNIELHPEAKPAGYVFRGFTLRHPELDATVALEGLECVRKSHGMKEAVSSLT